ncbi:MAG TPA: response regulator [Spirochaetota bacterium]|nr:response regulator [Spirochaetota bacterium]
MSDEVMDKYIVIIDDSPTIRRSVELILQGEGFSIQQAVNGREAILKIDQIRNEGNDIALCISDINMPVLNGFEFLDELRKIDKFTPVVMLTTEKEQAKIQKGKTSGAAGWMVKPFHPEELLKVVRRFVR